MPLSDIELRGRFWTDPFFRALVQAIAPGGYTDGDGVHHEGPTMAGARQVERFLDAVESLDHVIVPKVPVAGI